MAVITLAGNTIGCCIGTGSFEGVGTAFSSAKQSVKSLARGIATLKSKIDTARVAANVDASHTQAQNAEKREETKQGALTTGYDKLENLISDVGTVDNKAADKIRERKNDFYAKYSYLKPECEKSTREKIKDKWEGVKSWCKEHWKDLVKALAVAVLVVASVLLLVFVPGGGLLSAILLGAAKGCLIGLATSVAMNGIINKMNGKGFWDGALDAAFSGAVGGFIGGGITGGLLGNTATFGKVATKGIFNAAKSFGGAFGKGFLIGALSNSASNAGVTALSYWLNNGTLEGCGEQILISTLIGALSGGIMGGIMGGIQYKIADFRVSRIESKIENSGLSPQDKGRMFGELGVEEYGKRYPNSNYASEGRISSNGLINKNGNASFSKPDLLVETSNSGNFNNYDFKYGDAVKTYNQGVLTGVKGVTAGTGDGNSHVMDTVFSSTKQTVMNGNFSTNFIPNGTPFYEVHIDTFNKILGVPLKNEGVFAGISASISDVFNKWKE